MGKLIIAIKGCEWLWRIKPNASQSLTIFRLLKFYPFGLTSFKMSTYIISQAEALNFIR